MNKLKMLYRQTVDVAEKISSSTGKAKLFIIIDILICVIKYQSSPNNYYNFGFYNMNSRHRKTYTTYALSEKIQKKYNNEKYIKIFYDKYLFYKRFKDYYGRDCIKTNDLTVDKLKDFAKGQSKLIYKPLMGGEGKGIEVFNITEDNIESVYNKIKTMQSGVVETWIEQHKDITDNFTNAVAPLRIVTIYKNGKCHFLISMITFGFNTEISNAMQNCIFAYVDIKTGKIYTDGCDIELKIYKTHPQTGAAFKGFQIPYWEETLEMLKKASALIPEIGYIGWDVAITNNGPLIIEGNNDPGYALYQLSALSKDSKGTREIYKEFL